MTSAQEQIPKPLTRRQHEVLDFIQQYLSFYGYAPRLDDIGAHLGVSKAAIHQHLGILEALGYIARDPRRARAISVLPQAEGLELYSIYPDSPVPVSLALERAKRAIIPTENFSQATRSVLMTQIIHTARLNSLTIHEYSDIDNQLVPLAWQGPWRRGQTPPSYSLSEGIPGYVFDTGEVFLSNAAHSELAVPVIDVDGKTIGATTLTSNRRDWFPPELGEELQAVVDGLRSQREGHSLAQLTGADPVAVNLWLIQNSLARHFA